MNLCPPVQVPNALEFADWIGRTKRKKIHIVGYVMILIVGHVMIHVVGHAPSSPSSPILLSFTRLFFFSQCLFPCSLS